MILLIGNIIALIASLLMVYSGILKNKKRILYVQSVQIGLFVISNIVLGGISGAIINGVNFIRNIVCYKNKLGLKEKIFLTIISIGLTIYFNNLGIIGYLPLIASVAYIWLMTIKDVKKFKLLIMFTVALWGVYDFTIKSYTATTFDLLTFIANFVTINKIKKKA